VWAESVAASIVIPSDARTDDPTDTRDYIVIGEDVPAEVAGSMNAGLVFHNKSGFTDGVNGQEPLYWALGITKTSGQLEMIAYYNLGNAGGFAYTAVTMFSLGIAGGLGINLGTQHGSFPGADIVSTVADNLFTNFMRTNNTTDVSATSTGHAVQIGDDGGVNLAIDNNEIMVRNNGVESSFFLNTPRINNSPQDTNAAAPTRKDYVDQQLVSGSLSITPSAANVPTSGNVTFPHAFATVPNVVTTPGTSVPGTAVTGTGVTAVTTTGCTVWVTRTNTTATNVIYHAHGGVYS
jgi:hypothetical protein